MDTLLTCPRCNAFVQPDWPSCKICGFDPSYEGTYESIYAAKPKPVRPEFGQTLGAIVTLVLLIGAFWLIGSTAYNRYHHKDDRQPRQELVSIDR